MRVEGGSMSPRIAPGQMIEVREGSSECWGELHQGDVILFLSNSSHIPLIKAIRGLPGGSAGSSGIGAGGGHYPTTYYAAGNGTAGQCVVTVY